MEGMWCEVRVEDCGDDGKGELGEDDARGVDQRVVGARRVLAIEHGTLGQNLGNRRCLIQLRYVRMCPCVSV